MNQSEEMGRLCNARTDQRRPIDSGSLAGAADQLSD